jgi:hypothetical protein
VNKLKQWLKWAAISLLVLLLVPLAVWIGWNAFDETLDPLALAFGAPRASALADADNGYIAAIGMNAPDGASTFAFGQAWLARERAAARQGQTPQSGPATRLKGQVLCNPSRASCAEALRDNPDAIAAQLAARQEDLARYEQLLAYRHYEEVRDYDPAPDSELPSVANLNETQRAYLARAGLSLQQGQVEQALNMLEREFAFRRLMLNGSHSLLQKLIANNMYAVDLAFLADLLQHRGAELKPHAARLSAMLPALDPAALSLDAAIAVESHFVSQNYLMLGTRPDSVSNTIIYRLLGLVSKPNATRKLSYQVYSAMATASRASAKDFAAEWQKLPNPGDLFQVRFWDFFDNPVGKMSLSIAISNLDTYVLRMHDLDAFNRLLALRVSLLASDIDDAGIAAFVEHADPRLHDPYTEKPIVWDASARRLSVQVSEGLAKRQLVYVDKGCAFVQL